MKFVQIWVKQKANLILILSLVFGCVLVTAAYLIELHFINSRVFSSFIFLNNSDSLTLPLVHKSILAGDAFQWKFSTQLFIFPEGLMYFITTLFMLNIKATLILNGLFNMIALYLLVFLVLSKLKDTTNWINPIISALITVFILFLMMLEKHPSSLVLTPFLTTTYYGGVILASILGAWLALSIIDHRSDNVINGKIKVITVIALVLATLTTVSNPLFLAWYLLPLLCVSALGFLFHFFTLRKTILVSAPIIAGSLIGMATRSLLKRFTGTSINGYLHPDKIIESVISVKNSFLPLLDLHYQQLEYSIIILSFVILISNLCFLFARTGGLTNRINTVPKAEQKLFFIIGLGITIPMAAIVVTIVSGNSVLRYFIPIIITPIFAGLSLVAIPSIYSKLIQLRFIILIPTMIIFTGGIASIPDVKALTNYYSPDTQCIDLQLPQSGYQYGLASFWNARTLELDSRTGKRLTQVQSDLKVSHWMSNLSDYNRDFSFIIVNSENTGPADINADTVNSLIGSPTKISHCQNFTIYLYEPGTPENKKLNDVIQNNLAETRS